MPVSASSLYIPTNYRILDSEIQIGNVVFLIHERRVWYDLWSNYTSRFIAALVEASMSGTENE